MFNFWPFKTGSSNFTCSELYDDTTFYKAFIKDLENCREEVIIESPYITTERMKMFKLIFEKLIKKGVKVFVITRDPKEHDESLEMQSEEGIYYFEVLGVQVLLCDGNHHRKLALIDRKITWEGSLNILSQNRSREIMRRIESPDLTQEMPNFLKLEKILCFLDFIHYRGPRLKLRLFYFVAKLYLELRENNLV